MLTEREQFKVAFLRECAERGLTFEETHQVIKQALEKQAVDPLGAIGRAAGGVASAGGSILGRLLGLGGRAALTTAVLAPVALGATTGYMLGSNSGASDEDIAEEKQRELTDAYRLAADRARSRNRLAARKRSQPHSVRSLI